VTVRLRCTCIPDDGANVAHQGKVNDAGYVLEMDIVQLARSVLFRPISDVCGWVGPILVQPTQVQARRHRWAVSMISSNRPLPERSAAAYAPAAAAALMSFNLPKTTAKTVAAR
jgi:hypothetical protein